MPTKKNVKKDQYVLIRHANRHIRKAPNRDAESMHKVTVDEKIPYLGIIQNGWYKVKFNGKIGWLTASAGDVHEDNREPLKLIRGNWHIHTEPKAKSESLLVVNEKTAVFDLGETENNWQKVEKDGVVGWMSRRAITNYK